MKDNLTATRKKIVFVVNSLNLGGTENLVVQMTHSFQSEYDISLICLDEPGLWAQKIRAQGMPVHCLWRQPGRDLAVGAKIAGYCRKHKIDLIHAHQCTPWFYSALSRLFYRSPKLVFEEHGRLYPERYSWKKNIINKLIIQNLTSKIVAVSEDVRRRLIKYEGVSKGRIQVIYNGSRIPTPLGTEKRTSLRQELGFTPDHFVVGMIGRLDPIKNIPMFLNAFAGLRLKYTNFKGLLVGNGPDYDKIKTLCNSLEIGEHITMTGYRQDATDLLQCLDLYVLCSLSEGTSMALLEAMATGIPAVVTDVGGNPELITHQQTGWLVPTESIEDLKTAIQQAYTAPDKRRRMSQNAIEEYKHRFSYGIMEENYRKIYESILPGSQKNAQRYHSTTNIRCP